MYNNNNDDDHDELSNSVGIEQSDSDENFKRYNRNDDQENEKNFIDDDDDDDGDISDERMGMDEDGTGIIINKSSSSFDEEVQFREGGGGGKKNNGEINDDGDISHFNFLKQFTFRSVFVGLIIGGLLCFSNTYYGLQSGFITMGSLQSTLLGFLFFKLISNKLSSKFNHFENVLLQTVAVATATMPLAGGFVGIIPALKILYEQQDLSNDSASPTDYPNYFSWWGLTLWSFSIAFFGLFFSVPLRKQTILVEKLKFPSGAATAQMIKVLHNLKDSDVHSEMLVGHYDSSSNGGGINDSNGGDGIQLIQDTTSEFDDSDEKQKKIKEMWGKRVKVLFYSFLVSFIYTMLSYFFPILQALPIFGNYVKSTFFWTLTPSLSYVGQGMIMGTRTGISSLIGAIIGWAILGPIANSAGWVIQPSKDVPSSLTGVKGWIIWISLFVMLGESLISLLVLVIRTILIKMGKIKNHGKYSEELCVDPAPVNQRVPNSWWIAGTVISGVCCVIIVSPLFGIEVYETTIAVVLSLLTSILAVRALGETDINPVSGIGKISQIVFALVSPKNIVANLVAGAIAEGGSQQAGDMMQDLKTGHLLKASPRVQFYGQVIGSFFSIFFAVIAYQLYSYAYTIGPGEELTAPTAMIWLNMAKLVNGGELAHNVLPFCIVLGVLVSMIPIIEAFRPDLEHYLPSGIAIAIGFYQTPNYTLIRFVGTIIQYYWHKKDIVSFREYGIIVASGFVLGEGITSIITAIMTIVGVPKYK